MYDNCPWCKEDIEEWLRLSKVSCYGGEFDCPNCNKRVRRDYEEMWDGEEEHNYYFLTQVEE